MALLDNLGGFRGQGLLHGDVNEKGEVNPELLAPKSFVPKSSGGGGFDFGRVGFGILQDMMESAPGTKPGSSGILDIYENDLKKQAFRNSANEDGTINKVKLVANLLKNGFGEDALKIQGSEESTRAKLTKGMIAQVAKDKLAEQVALRNEKLDALAERRVRAQEGELGRKIRQAELETGVSFGSKNRPGGSIIQQQIQRQPAQTGQASVESGVGGRGIASALVGQPGELADPQGWEFSNKYDNLAGGLEPIPVTFAQKQQRYDRIQKQLKEQLGTVSSADNQRSLNNLLNVKKQVGKISDDNLLPRIETGQFKGPIGTFFKSPGFEQLSAGLRGLSFKNIPKGMSRLFDSEAERKMYEESQPSVNNSPLTNYNLISAMEADMKMAMEHANFKKSYAKRNNGLEGSDEAWNSYANNNPTLIKNTKGVAVENELALTPQQYFSQEAKGAIPLPIDWDDLNKNYSAKGNPLSNIPKETINSLEEDQLYMTPDGAMTGKIIKGINKMSRGGR